MGWRMRLCLNLQPFNPSSLHLRHRSFSNPSTALPMLQLKLQLFPCFTYVTGTSPTSQHILQPFRSSIYTTAHITTLPPLLLRHRSFFNPSAASPSSQLILQPFRRFTYVTAHSPNLPLLHLRHRHFTHVTAHSRTLPPLYLYHSSFDSPSVVPPTS